MPHRVTNFLRASSSHCGQKKKAAGSGCGSSSATPSPYASDSDDNAVRMPDRATDGSKKSRRLSLPFCRLSASRENAFHALHHHHHLHHASSSAAVSLDWSIESPPVVFHGTADESTGALISGQMIMDVREDSVEVDNLSATLLLNVRQKRPFQNHCCACQQQTRELKTWRLLSHSTPTTLRRGRHPFPFSTLLEGHLPASVDTTVISVTYTFKAEAIVVRGSGTSCASVRFERDVTVKRSLPEAPYPHHSVRVFPPTNIQASAHYNHVIHPTSSTRLTLRINGLVARSEQRPQALDLWRLKKVTWRLEETAKTVAPACSKHAAPEAAAADDDSRRAVRSETRVLGEKQLHEGWKSDFGDNDGTVHLELDFCVTQHKPHSHHLKYACDTKTRDGTEVTHSLLIELIVSRELAPDGKLDQTLLTGTGRILRMRFSVVLTEFAGLGVSWDNEAPPVYQDVPPSPPAYPSEEPIEYEELDALDARRASLEPSCAAAAVEAGRSRCRRSLPPPGSG